MRRRETPIKRKNPSGKTVFVARWTDKTGERRYGWKPDIPGTYALKREAQDAIDACHEREDKGPTLSQTVGAYASTWMSVHPRTRVTATTNNGRLRAVLDVEIEGTAFRDWPLEMLRRRHANALADHMLRVQGRAYTGANAVLGVLSAMIDDAIEDEAGATVNPFRGMKRVRKNDPRIQKQRRPIRVWSWAQMHAFAAACAAAEKGSPEVVAWRRVYAEPMVRVLSDCGLRVGELFALCHSDLGVRDGVLEVRWSISGGEVAQGTKTDHGERDAGRVVPVPPELLRMLVEMPKRLDAVVMRGTSQERLLFSTPRGSLWPYAQWSRDVWRPGREATETDLRPHEMRHAWVSLLRAAGVDPADVAQAGGHTLHTANQTYTHALRRSFDAMREAVGE